MSVSLVAEDLGVGVFSSQIEIKWLFNPQNRLEMGEFFQETIDNHRATFDPSNIRDLVDMYLAEIQRAKEEGTGEALFEGKDHGEGQWQLNSGLIETSERRCLEHQGNVTNGNMEERLRFECSQLFADEVLSSRNIIVSCVHLNII